MKKYMLMAAIALGMCCLDGWAAEKPGQLFGPRTSGRSKKQARASNPAAAKRLRQPRPALFGGGTDAAPSTPGRRGRQTEEEPPELLVYDQNPQPQTTGQDTVVDRANGRVMAPYEYEPPYEYDGKQEAGVLMGMSPMDEMEPWGPFKAPEPEPEPDPEPREWQTADPQWHRPMAQPGWTSGVVEVTERQPARPMPVIVDHEHENDPPPPPPTPECVEQYRVKLEQRLLDRYNNLPQYAGRVGKVEVVLSRPAEHSIDGKYIRAAYDQLVYDSWGVRMPELEKEYFSVTFGSGGVRHVRSEPSIRVGLDAEKIYSEAAPPVADPFRNVVPSDAFRPAPLAQMPAWWRPEFDNE